MLFPITYQVVGEKLLTSKDSTTEIHPVVYTDNGLPPFLSTSVRPEFDLFRFRLNNPSCLAIRRHHSLL
jgi:hypothetical protein